MSIIKTLAKRLLVDLKKSNPRSDAVKTFEYYLTFQGNECCDEALFKEVKLLRDRLNNNIFTWCGLFRSSSIKKIDEFLDEYELIKNKCHRVSVFNLAIATHVDIILSQNMFTLSFCLNAAQAFNEFCVMPLFLTNEEDIKKAKEKNYVTTRFPDELRLENAKANRDWVSSSLLYRFFGIGSSYIKKIDRFIHLGSVVVEEKEKKPACHLTEPRPSGSVRT